VEVGGVPYLVPTVQMDKLYEMKDFPDLADFDFSDEKSALILGAGAAPWTYLERNAEVDPEPILPNFLSLITKSFFVSSICVKTLELNNKNQKNKE